MNRKSLSFSNEQLWLLYDALSQACDFTKEHQWEPAQWAAMNKLHDRIRDAYHDSFDHV